MRRRLTEHPQSNSAGFTYLGVLLAIALISVGLTLVSEVWTTVAHQQKLIQLRWIGQQYAQAIESYYYANTGTVNYYPQSLKDLLEDSRYLYIRRHIRTLYPNPFTEEVDWQLMPAPTGGFNGVQVVVEDDPPRTERFVFLPIRQH